METPQKLVLSGETPAFTPKLGRVDPVPLSPEMESGENVTPETKQRRASLAKFVWPSSLVSLIPFNSNKSLFSEEDRELVKALCRNGQAHLWDDWESLGTNDDKKRAFIAQLHRLNNTYPGGIFQYLRTARSLLAAAAEGANPLDGWTPEVPLGADLTPGTPEFDEKEELGMQELGKVGFVLVAGGLGERLGYNGIKIGLPSETTTGTSYIELYCRHIAGMQARYCTGADKLSLAIMVSADTVDKTKALLEKEGNFGIDITLMLQEKVPALSDSNASLVLSEEDQYVLDAKPHGHGDVHVLMHKEGVAKAWAQRGVKWVAFFQDTNGLAFTTLPAALGVSVALGLEVNSVAVPRAAKQAVGALAKLKHTDGREMTINVEYNQLDPLLRATISPDGDVNDSVTGKSIFPGNINQLIFALEPYVVNLERTNGVMAEFVNPKYKDETKQAFKKPTRLECMMQDYPKELDGNAKVGFTQFPVWVCYSPCKNNSTDAAESIKKGVPAGSAWTAESDQYRAQAELLKLLGCNIDTSSEPVEFQGIPAVPGPRIIIDGTTAVFYSEMKNIFPNPSAVNISANSTLVVNGDVVIQELELDGALTLDAAKGSKLQVWASGDASKVVNAGHKLVALDATITENVSEIDSMRGFKMEKKEEKIVDTSTKQLVEGGKNIFVFTGNQLILEEHFDEPSPLNQACKSVFGFC